MPAHILPRNENGIAEIAPPALLSTIGADFLYGRSRVSTRFTTLANLETESGWCVTVAELPHSAAPNRILVAPATLSLMGLEPGAEAEIRRREILTPGGRFALTAEPTGVTDLPVPVREAAESLGRLLARFGVGAATYVEARRSEVTFPEAIVAELALSLPLRGAAQKLVGLGSGYTPSGDDILAGFVSAWAVYTGTVPDSLRELEHYALGRTTSLSATMLRLAMNGLIAQDLATVFRSLSRSGSDLDRRVEEYIRTVGHSSGSDTLFGVYLALVEIYFRERNNE